MPLAELIWRLRNDLKFTRWRRSHTGYLGIDDSKFPLNIRDMDSRPSGNSSALPSRKLPTAHSTRTSALQDHSSVRCHRFIYYGNPVQCPGRRPPGPEPNRSSEVVVVHDHTVTESQKRGQIEADFFACSSHTRNVHSRGDCPGVTNDDPVGTKNVQ